ncbi:Pet127-domain-containing protein [Pluteus cervinus]|uniref:Pet127-domain-containing protein n=1 Tax=Pluteus cervinus TaxID=181527 RepID=A0ACD3B6V4_9AGAR|nr:Pet127-domain-containing protein [Pluteus cervinus]
MSILAAQRQCLRSPFLKPSAHRLISPIQAHSCRSHILWNGLATQPSIPKKKKKNSPGPSKLADFLKQSITKAPKSKFKSKAKGSQTQRTPELLVPRTKGTRKGVKKERPNPQFWTDGWGEDKLKPPAGTEARDLKTEHHWDEANPESLDYSSQEYTRRIEGLIDSAGSSVLCDLAPPSQQRPVAKLAHGLERVLFNPGVHWLQDPRSFVYNFPPSLQQIPKVTDFAFERLSGFIKSSRDEDLWTLARQEKRTFAGSTSSLTGMLSHIYFLLSGDKPVDTSTLTSAFRKEPTNFTPGQRMPSSVLLNYNNGVYAIDSDSDQTDKNILTWMGTLLEKYVTMEPSEFTTYMRHSPPADNDTDDNRREAYRYAKSDRIVMRSQLDCQDRRLPGTGVFDIKTRACLPIRLDILNFEENSGYLIRSQNGLMESFEREYYDLIRSAFLKYNFQVRIGNMDGVFVAYHNTARLFGFQYVPLEEMDARLFGPEPGIGDRIFEKCLSILECVADEIIRCFPEQSVKCTFETLEDSNVMNIWVEPAVWTLPEERPIKQLTVELKHKLGKTDVSPQEAIESSHERPWGVRWSVSWLSKDDEEIRRDFADVQERKFHAWNLPSGVGPEEMAQFWKDLNFNRKPDTPDSPEFGELENYDPGKFKVPSRSIQKLRLLSRAGRMDTERLELEMAGKPKIVLGEPEPPLNEDLIVQAAETSDEWVDINDVPVDDLPSFASIQSSSTAESWTPEPLASNSLDTTESDTTDSPPKST